MSCCDCNARYAREARKGAAFMNRSTRTRGNQAMLARSRLVGVAGGLGFALAVGSAAVAFADTGTNYETAATATENGADNVGSRGGSLTAPGTPGARAYDVGANAGITGVRSPNDAMETNCLQASYQPGASESPGTGNHSYSQSDYQLGSSRSPQTGDGSYSQSNYQFGVGEGQ